MKIFNIKMILTFLMTLMIINISNAHVEANPTCILMKFTDDTRYDEANSAEELSNRVLMEILQSGKLNLSMSNPLDEDIEKLLYDEKIREYTVLERAMASGNFSELFESAAFNEHKAQSIATAQVGQFISPEITSKIGKEHDADYLIQGTIINLGVGNWWNGSYEEMSNAINMASSFMNMASASDLAGATSPMGVNGIDVKKIGIGVQCDIRIIKAATGEVIWCKRVTEVASQKQFDIGYFSVGNGKLNSTLYAKAMDKAAKKIVKLLIEDLDNNKLFIK